jgi:trimeric autotransporter adhesin
MKKLLLITLMVFLSAGLLFSQTMNTKLRNATFEGSQAGFGIIPATDPYLGTTTVNNQLPATMVDWVLVELRATTNGATVAQKVGCLLADGSVTDTTGTNGLSFTGLESSTSYYIVVKHRNHLAIMSSSAVQIDESNGANEHDFTVSGSAYGGSDELAFKQVGSVYAMRAGDGDGNGQIQTTDKSQWNTQSGLSGYRSADYDMNGFIQTNDVSVYYYGNSGSASQVPAQ